jgi:hypothetical protein
MAPWGFRTRHKRYDSGGKENPAKKRACDHRQQASFLMTTTTGTMYIRTHISLGSSLFVTLLKLRCPITLQGRWWYNVSRQLKTYLLGWQYIFRGENLSPVCCPIKSFSPSH